MLDALVRGVDVVTDCCPDPRDLARGNRRAHTGAADEDAALRLAVLDRGAELGGLVRVVDPDRVGVGAEVDDLVTLLAQRFEDLVPEMDAAMVEGNGDVHAADRTLSGPRIDS